jgi:hypothetical protein
VCGPPSAYELTTSTVATTLEPSGDPTAPQFHAYCCSQDDAHHMYTDQNMYNLCVPGALTNALSYWGKPVASYGTYVFTDLSVANNNPPGITKQTTWGDISYNDLYNGGNENIDPHAHRSYMMYLAWLSDPAGEWAPGYTGVMSSTSYPSIGAYLQWQRDVANWEASGENPSTWSNFFYTINWHYDSQNNKTGGQQADLLTDVENDLWYSHVPVMAEVNAELMPNWTNNNGRINHAITIIGYDNSQSIYYYTDTFGSGNGRGTGCGANYQQRVYTIDQYKMWAAIDSVPVNPSTGDGGWIW